MQFNDNLRLHLVTRYTRRCLCNFRSTYRMFVMYEILWMNQAILISSNNETFFLRHSNVDICIFIFISCAFLVGTIPLLKSQHRVWFVDDDYFVFKLVDKSSSASFDVLYPWMLHIDSHDINWILSLCWNKCECNLSWVLEQESVERGIMRTTFPREFNFAS